MFHKLTKVVLASSILIGLSGPTIAQGVDAQSNVAPVPAAPTTVTKKVYSFTLASGADSAAITPPASLPVSVTAVQLSVGFRGVASVTMLRINNSFLEWTGLSSPSGAAIEEGFGASPTQHIVWVDYGHAVDLQVASANSFVVHNASGTTATVKVTLVY